jgi:hypothetical protein
MSTEYNLHCRDCGYGVWIASGYMTHSALFPSGEDGKRDLLRFLFEHVGHAISFIPDRDCDLPALEGDEIVTWSDDGEMVRTPVADWPLPGEGEEGANG